MRNGESSASGARQLLLTYSDECNGSEDIPTPLETNDPKFQHFVRPNETWISEVFADSRLEFLQRSESLLCFSDHSPVVEELSRLLCRAKDHVSSCSRKSVCRRHSWYRNIVKSVSSKISLPDEKEQTKSMLDHHSFPLFIFLEDDSEANVCYFSCFGNFFFRIEFVFFFLLLLLLLFMMSRYCRVIMKQKLFCCCFHVVLIVENWRGWTVKVDFLEF